MYILVATESNCAVDAEASINWVETVGRPTYDCSDVSDKRDELVCFSAANVVFVVVEVTTCCDTDWKSNGFEPPMFEIVESSEIIDTVVKLDSSGETVITTECNLVVARKLKVADIEVPVDCKAFASVVFTANG